MNTWFTHNVNCFSHVQKIANEAQLLVVLGQMLEGMSERHDVVSVFSELMMTLRQEMGLNNY